jgi:o-succinylbenzoate synthase
VNNLELTYSPYNLKLKKSFSTSKGDISVRKGFIISLMSSTHAEGIGEAAPLPEFGSETYEEDEQALKDIRLNLKLDLNNLVSSIEVSLTDFNHLPALRSGVEQALLNLICIERKTTLSELFKKPVTKNISVNGVIGLMNSYEAVNKAKKQKSEGYRTIKVKVGRDNFEDDFNVLKSIREITGKNLKLRIDANSKWNVKEAVTNLKQLEPIDIEYIEQPVADIEDFPEVKSGTSIPLAADESLRSFEDSVYITKNNLAQVLILKPMMLGGLTTTMRIINEAEKNNLKVVITSSFETSIGRSIAVFAAGILKQKTAHGLSIADYFENTIVNDPFPVKSGIIQIGT